MNLTLDCPFTKQQIHTFLTSSGFSFARQQPDALADTLPNTFDLTTFTEKYFEFSVTAKYYWLDHQPRGVPFRKS
jgi:hypothetical protein